MRDDYDKRQWQAEQAARDAALDKQRDREAKARARAARNAERKIKRLKATLQDRGELTEWEAEFSDSVTERLDTFGSAFNDREKGRPGDALSFAQKKVVSALKAKVTGKKPGGFQSKNKKTFTPRVRQIEDDMMDDDSPVQAEAQSQSSHSLQKEAPFIPDYDPPQTPRKPFLRIVKNDDEIT